MVFELQDIKKLDEIISESKFEIVKNNNIILVFKEDNKILGIIDFSIIYDRAEINYIYVLKKYRMNKIASKMFDEMLQRCKNLINITLEVRVDNESAIKFYYSKGFEIVTTRENYYQNVNGYLMLKVIK